MGKIISDGIKQAEERLRKEQQRLLLQQEQGLISYIPIVGSVWNYWWSAPHTNENSSPTVGHSVNLISSEFAEQHKEAKKILK